jgi:hypothetical protein
MDFELVLHRPIETTRLIGEVKHYFKWTVRALTRWDEKAGLHGMRYAPSCSTCSRHKEKETGNAEA